MVSLQVQDVSRMKWGMNTNVNAIFDLILKVLPSSQQGCITVYAAYPLNSCQSLVALSGPMRCLCLYHLLQMLTSLLWHMQKAVATRLKPEDMVSTIFIFSDMEFDQADEKAANPLGAIVSSRVPSKGFTVSRRPKSNFESIKVSTPRWAIAYQPLWLPLGKLFETDHGCLPHLRESSASRHQLHIPCSVQRCNYMWA